MSKPVKAIPEGYTTITPYLITSNNAAKAIEFYKKAFGAVEVLRIPGPSGSIGHAELRIRDFHLMLSDGMCDGKPLQSVQPKEKPGISLLLYVEDVDTMVEQAVAAGATLIRPVENQFYGDRSGGVQDPFGHIWYLSTHIEDVSPEEMKKRAEACIKSAAAAH